MLSGAADPWPEIADSPDAPPVVRSVFDDVRAVTGSPVINQLFRRLASDEALLQRVWLQWRPLYVSKQTGLIVAQLLHATGSLLDGIQPEDILRQVPQQTWPHLSALTRTYLMNNARNLLAAQALFTDAPGVPVPASPPMTRTAWPLAAVTLPNLPDLADLLPEIRDRIERLNRFGDAPAPRSLASFWRHIGLYPGFLYLVESRIEALEPRVDLPALRDATRMLAQSLATQLTPIRLEDGDRAKIRDLIGDLADITIPKMIPITLILDRDMSVHAEEVRR